MGRAAAETRGTLDDGDHHWCHHDLGLLDIGRRIINRDALVARRGTRLGFGVWHCQPWRQHGQSRLSCGLYGVLLDTAKAV